MFTMGLDTKQHASFHKILQICHTKYTSSVIYKNKHAINTICSTNKLSVVCMTYYHTSNSRECMGVNGEGLQLHAVYKKPYFLLQVTREFVSVLQVT